MGDQDANSRLATSVYVNNLPFQATQDEVTHLFEQFGQIKDVDMRRVRRGFCFVDFADKESVNRAVEARELVLRNRELRVQVRRPLPPLSVEANGGPQEENRSLFVKNLPQDIHPEEISKFFEHYGQIDSVDADRLDRGIVFVKFADRQSLLRVLEAQPKLNDTELFLEEKRPYRRRAPAGPRNNLRRGPPPPDRRRGPPRTFPPNNRRRGPPPSVRSNDSMSAEEKDEIDRSLYVKGLHPDVNEDELRKVFSKFGSIDTVNLNFTNRGYGFVVFGNRDAMLNAASSTEGIRLGEETLAVAERRPNRRPNRRLPLRGHRRSEPRGDNNGCGFRGPRRSGVNRAEGSNEEFSPRNRRPRRRGPRRSSGADEGYGNAERKFPEHEVYVGNLPRDVRREELKTVFEEQFQVNVVKVLYRAARKFAFVQLDNEADVEKVLEPRDRPLMIGEKDLRVERRRPFSSRSEAGDAPDQTNNA